jgi:hypothetical protein
VALLQPLHVGGEGDIGEAVVHVKSPDECTTDGMMIPVKPAINGYWNNLLLQ